MKLEYAENFIRCDNCENCPYLVKNTDEFECDADEKCFDVFKEASKKAISSRDDRIAELEKSNTELVAENERMRCCWNCKSSGIETEKVQNHTQFQCNKWNEVFYDLIPCEHWQRKEQE